MAYADKQELEEEIIRRHHGNMNWDEYADDDEPTVQGGTQQTQSDHAFRSRPKPGAPRQ